MKKYRFFGLILVCVGLLLASCNKDNLSLDSIYTPTASDVTANATLEQLQQGRRLYINNCGSCHSLPSPDSYNTADWQGILSSMVPRTSLSSANAALVSKYLRRGQ
jgi:hypothetical protein